MKLAWTSRSQYLFENHFFSFTSNLTKFQWIFFLQLIILGFFSMEILYCVPKRYFFCLLYIYTFLITSFRFFVQWIDLGPKNPLQLAYSGYQETKIFWTKHWGGSLDFNLNVSTKFVASNLQCFVANSFVVAFHNLLWV